MNKFLVLACIAAAVVLGLAIAYYLEIPPALAIVDAAKAQITELTGGAIDTNTLIAGGTTGIASAAAGIALNQFNQKKAAFSSAISSSNLKEQAEAKFSDLTAEFDQTKESLTTQMYDYKQTAEAALVEAGTAKTEAESLKKQLETQVQQTTTASQMNTNTIQNLWKNSGGDWWTDPNTGEKFKLLSLVTEKVI